MSELKPCPFCGSEKIGLGIQHNRLTFKPHLVAGCCDCGGKVDSNFSTPEEAVEAWNRRAKDE